MRKLLLIVFFVASLNCNTSKAEEIKDLESIPLYLIQRLNSANYLEDFIARTLQIIRHNGKDGKFISEEYIQQRKDEKLRQLRSSQVSNILLSDLNNDGEVTKDEIEERYKSLPKRKMSVMPKHIKKLMKYDLNEDGVIDYKEMRNVSTLNYMERQFKEMDEVIKLDPNKDGVITAEELKLLAIESFNIVDKEKDGTLSVAERSVLRKLVQKGREWQQKTRKQREFKALIPDRIELPENGEVHVIGVHQSNSKKLVDYYYPKLTVGVKRKNVPLVLVLSSYAPGLWEINREEGVDIRGVILSGYNDQKVVGLSDKTKVIKFTSEKGDKKVVFVTEEKNHKNSAFQRMRATVGNITGKDITSFQGERYAHHFVIADSIFSEGHAFSFPPDHKFSPNAEVHMVSSVTASIAINVQTSPKKKVNANKYNVAVTIKENTNPIVLALTSPLATQWKINNPHDVKIEGIIVSGSFNQSVSGITTEKIPIVYQEMDASTYKSSSYKTLVEYIKNTVGLDITSYRSGRNISEFTVLPGSYFPDNKELLKNTGKGSIPNNSTILSSAKEHNYIVPEPCNSLHVMAWGGGGGSGSRTAQNDGGGGGYVYGELVVKSLEKLKVIVGGGGKVGSHYDERDHRFPLAFNGKGGFPDGGEGSVGKHGAGGGGGGASRIKRGKDSILIAGGGGGGSSNAGIGGAGGGGTARRHDFYRNSVPNYKAIHGQGGNEGIGGKGGQVKPSRINNFGIDHPGKVGTDTDGGDAGKGGRLGAGGGGGGFGGGGGGAANHHYPGGGGGGGSFGKIIISGEGFKPGNSDQSNGSGAGGRNRQDGKDGKVIFWCNET